MKNAVFGKNRINVGKHVDSKPETTERRRKYLVSEPKYHITTFFFQKNFLVIKIIKLKY